LDFLLALFSIGIFQGIVLAFIILKSPIFKSSANRYLAFAVLALSFSLLNLVLEQTGTYGHFAFAQIVDVIDSGTLFLVFIHFFIINQAARPETPEKKRYWLFIPYLLSLVISSLETSIDWESASLAGQVTFSLLMLLNASVELVFIPGLLLFTYTFLKYSENSKERKWLFQLWFSTATILCLWLVVVFAGFVFDTEVHLPMSLVALFAAMVIHWIAYAGIYQFRLAHDQTTIKAFLKKSAAYPPAAYTSVSGPTPPVTDETLAPGKTKDAGAGKGKSVGNEKVYFEQIERLCLEEHVYLDSTLDRDKVASMLGISPSYVSRLVNTMSGDNFSTYINRHRVEAIKRMMADPEFENYSLLAIGLESGFAAKTTFHQAFKKITGVTPSAYRKANKTKL